MTVVHVCGHEEVHRLKGTKRRRGWEAQRLKGLECTKCWAQKADELEASLGLRELPKLKGTKRQQCWARSIRAQDILKLRGEAARIDRVRSSKSLPPVGEAFLGLAVGGLLAFQSAKWWIENRTAWPSERLDASTQEAIEELRADSDQTIVLPACFAPPPDCPF